MENVAEDVVREAPGELHRLSGSIGLQTKVLALGTRLLGPVAPRLAGSLAYRMWFRTITPSDPEWALPVLREAERKSVRMNGARVTTYAWGDAGPTVLLMHGWNSHTGYMTAFVRPLLERGFRVVAFDAPAHGRSPGDRTDIFEVRDVLLGIADALPPLEGVVAHSFGSLALLDAGAHGLRAPARVLVSPGVRLQALLAAYRRQVGLSAATAADLGRRVSDFVGDGFYAGLWEGNDAPTLVLHDRDDDEIPFEEGRRLADRLPDARLSTTEALGHRRILRDPDVHEETARFIAGFSRPDGASDHR